MNGAFVGPEMTTGTAPKGQLMWLGLTVLVALSGLCMTDGLSGNIH
jgi:hypothetical protein